MQVIVFSNKASKIKLYVYILRDNDNNHKLILQYTVIPTKTSSRSCCDIKQFMVSLNYKKEYLNINEFKYYPHIAFPIKFTDYS